MENQFLKTPTDFTYLKKVLAFPCVKETLFQVVYYKLFVDGYVYCSDGLCKSSKEQLKKQIKGSAFRAILRANNPTTYEEVFDCFLRVIRNL